jgi:hypothetical protein
VSQGDGSPSRSQGSPSEVDVAVFSQAEQETTGRETLLAVGEAKWNDTMSLARLERLRRIRHLLASRAIGATASDRTRLLCFTSWSA